METPVFEKLCHELEALLALNPSKPEELQTWIKKAHAIKEDWESVVERHQFSYMLFFLDDYRFMAKHLDFYESESRKIREIIADYRATRHA